LLPKYSYFLIKPQSTKFRVCCQKTPKMMMAEFNMTVGASISHVPLLVDNYIIHDYI